MLFSFEFSSFVLSCFSSVDGVVAAGVGRAAEVIAAAEVVGIVALDAGRGDAAGGIVDVPRAGGAWSRANTKTRKKETTNKETGLLLSSFRLFVLSCFSSAAGLVRGEAVGRVLRIVGQADRGGEILAGVAGVVESAGQGDAAAAEGARR
jgi:hypothetical protein